MDRIEAMETFITVADQRGFARAARRLKTSPARVTRLVAALEERLGVELLHRTTRAVSLTDAGTRYLAQARDIVAAVNAAESQSAAEAVAPAGRFVVTAPVLFGRREVAPLLSKFLFRFPEVRAELILVDRVVDLVGEGVDAAVRIGALDDSGLKVRLLGASRRVVVASPAYLARRGRPRKPEDLASHATIEVTALGPWQFEREGRRVKVAIAPGFTTNSADVAIEHALRGGGLTQVLGYQVVDAVAAEKLEVVLPGFELPPRPIHVVYPASRQPSANLRAFVDFAVKTTRWQFVQL